MISSPYLAAMLSLSLAQTDARYVAHTVEGPQPAAALAPWGDNLVALRRDGASIPAPPLVAVVRLTTGEQILFDPKAPITLDEETLTFVPQSLQPVGGTSLQVPLASVTYLSFRIPTTMETPLPFLMKLARDRRTKDRVLLASGDQLVGAVTALDRAGTCSVTVEKAVEKIPLAQLGIVALNTELQSRPRIRSAYQRLVLTTGERVSLTAAQLDADGKSIAGQTLYGRKVRLNAAALVSLTVLLGAADYLSDLPATKYEATPFLGIEWPLFRDEDGRGGPLRLGGDVFDRGLALHSPAAVTYTLEGKYRWFESVVAVGGTKGRVRVSVLVDGKASKEVPVEERTSADAPLPLRIDVRGAKTLTLRADVGTLGDVQGMSLWGDARLVR